MRKVTIEDISRHTGLSRGTVSRALNNRPDISLQTKQRVLEACQQLNYVPSHAARSLATGRCYAVAVLVDELRNSFSSAYLRGVLAHAQEERYAVHVLELGADARQAIDRLCMIDAERVDSVLMAAPLAPELASQLLPALEARPFVTTESIEGFDCDVFAPDFVEAGRLVAQHIIRGSADEVAYIHEGGCAAAEDRLAGFEETCRARGLAPEHIVIRSEPGNPNRFDAVRARLGGLRAIAASNDYVAMEMSLLCRSEGRKPGEDIAIVGQGNEYFTARIPPGLSSVDFGGEEIGRRAMAVAIQRISKTRQDAPQITRVAPQLIVRDSSRMFV